MLISPLRTTRQAHPPPHPPTPHHFSAISTAKLIFQFLLCDIWLTEQRCQGQPSVGKKAEQVEEGRKIQSKKRRWGVERDKAREQTVSEPEESKQRSTGSQERKNCHIHPYHSSLRFPKCLFLRGTTVCTLTEMGCLCPSPCYAIHIPPSLCRWTTRHHIPSQALKYHKGWHISLFGTKGFLFSFFSFKFFPGRELQKLSLLIET